jgi:hypothetical protein
VNSLSWPAITIIVGIGLMLVAPLLFSAAPSSAYWTEADQTTYQQASADLHAATRTLPDSPKKRGKQKVEETPYDPVAAKAKYEAAKAAFDKQESRLHSARSRPTWLAWGLRLLGIAVTGIGVYGYFTAQPPPKSAPRSSTFRPSPSTSVQLPAPAIGSPPQPLPPGYYDIVTTDGPPPQINE